MISLDLETVQRLAQEVVVDAGESYINTQMVRVFSTPKCVYAFDECASCIVGRILYRAGVPINTLHAMDCEETSGISRLWEGGNLQSAFNIEFDSEETINYLSVLQQHQDYGKPWGYALHMAELALSEDFPDY